MKTAQRQHDNTAAWQGVWIAIPAYQEAATIRALAQAALAQSPNVIVVDDGSTDGTAQQLDGLPVTLLVHAHNRGKEASLRTAFAHALAQDAACVIAMDGDGQHDPADAPLLLAAWRRNPRRIVIGSRLHDRSQFPVARWRANRFACFWISWAAGHPIADSQSGFRYYPAAVFNSLDLRHDRWASFVFESEVLIAAARTGLEIVFVPISVRYADPARASHLHPLYDIGKIAAMIFKRLLRIRFDPRDLAHGLGANQSRRPPADPIARHSRKP